MTEPEDYIGSTLSAVKAMREGQEIKPGVYRIPIGDDAVIAELTVAQIIDVETDNTGDAGQ